MEPKILIGVPTAEFARQASFYDHFNLMEKPIGTMITFAHGQSPARNRNIIIQQAIEQSATHILFIDDDTVMPVDMLTKLLAHDKDIVTGLYCMRNFPHRTIIFDRADADGRCHYTFPEDGNTGLIPIVATGLGACLLKIEVFFKVERPWIRLGELEADHWCDDIGFFRRVREAGIEAFCDPTVLVGHMASVTISPQYIDGKYMVSYDTSGTSRVTIPLLRDQIMNDQAK